MIFKEICQYSSIFSIWIHIHVHSYNALTKVQSTGTLFSSPSVPQPVPKQGPSDRFYKLYCFSGSVSVIILVL